MQASAQKSCDTAVSTPRQRLLDTFNFAHPDKLPVVYHPSPAGLHVHGQKLLDLFNRLPPDNPVRFDRVPHPPATAVDADGRYHEMIRDEWGTLWECRIFGVHGHPKEYPFASWSEGLRHPLPVVPRPGSEAWVWEREEVQRDRQRHLVFKGWVSIFEKLHALRPIDEVLMDLATGENDILPFLDRLESHWLDVIRHYLEIGADVIMFGDDWGTQTGQLVSLPLFREVFKPRYARLMAPIKQAGKRVFFHSCGKLGPIFDELLDLGIDGYWPQITLYDAEPFAQKCREHRVAIYIHPDRQRLIPLGTPAEIDRRIREYAERYRRLGGGGILYVEIENDAPFANVQALIEAIHRHR